MVKVEHISLGGLPAVQITNEATNACVKACLFGGTVYSFIDTAGREQLFLSKEAITDGSKPVRGGIPIVFPQFGSGTGEGKKYPTLPSHGFARTSRWKFIAATSAGESTQFTLSLEASKKTTEGKELLKRLEEQGWPSDFEFCLELKVCFESTSFNMDLHIKNVGEKAFDFQALLHTYFSLEDVKQVSVEGLQASKFIDQLVKTEPTATLQQAEEKLKIDGEVDRIYLQDGNAQELGTPTQSEICITFVGDETKQVVAKRSLKRNEVEKPCDVVVWNPWIDKSQRMSDFGDEEYNSMICLEPGCVSRYETCESGHQWILSQHITFSS